tara:strand:- start:1156 stop:1440 length:285 start_codon:yes stop_codon:yes gene_type:complete
MKVIKSYSNNFIEEMNYLNKRYIFIRDVSMKKNFHESSLSFYRQLLMKDIQRRDSIYLILREKINGDICELILELSQNELKMGGIKYNVRPPLI